MLCQAFKRAVKANIVPRNVCQFIDRPAVAKKEAQFLGVSQVDTLLTAAAGDRLEALYWLALGAGLRLGECFALGWSDVDLEAGTVFVRPLAPRTERQADLAPPKSKAGRRTIALPQRAVDALVEHRKQMMVEGFAGSPNVFCNQHGGYLRRSHFHADNYKPLCEKAGLPGIKFHTLRHTSISLDLAQGTPMHVVSRRAGHANIGITVDTYGHVLEGAEQEAARKLTLSCRRSSADCYIVATFGPLEGRAETL